MSCIFRIDKMEPRAQQDERMKHRPFTITTYFGPPATRWNVCCDGGCEMNGKPTAKAIYEVYFGKDSPLNVLSTLEGDSQTNERAELMAAVRALEILVENGAVGTTVSIKTDSTHIIKWIKAGPIWISNGWKHHKGDAVQNIDLIDRVIQLSSLFGKKLKWVHVSGVGGSGHGEFIRPVVSEKRKAVCPSISSEEVLMPKRSRMCQKAR